jgi:hypothetical protein
MLDQAQVKLEATTLTLIASDGFTADVTVADARKCTDCLLAFTQDGKLTTAMPEMPSKAWVKDVIKIEVK